MTIYNTKQSHASELSQRNGQLACSSCFLPPYNHNLLVREQVAAEQQNVLSLKSTAGKNML